MVAALAALLGRADRDCGLADLEAPRPPRRPLDSARALLAERYARGELSGEEYRERLDELSRSFRGATSDG